MSAHIKMGVKFNFDTKLSPSDWLAQSNASGGYDPNAECYHFLPLANVSKMN